MFADKDLNPVYENQPYVDEAGNQYPAEFPKTDIKGLSLVTETPKPTDPALVVTGFIINKDHVQVWQTREMTAEEIEAREEAERQLALNEKAAARQDALAKVWPDAFDLIDDILERGIDAVKADRAAIKAANPK